MNFLASTKLAIDQILSAKARSLLTMLGVIIGVASLVALTSIASGATSGITDSLNGLGANKITVNAKSQTALMESDAQAIENLTDVAKVGTQVSTTTAVSTGLVEVAASLVGVSKNYLELNQPKLVAGSFLTNVESLQRAKQLVINQDLATELNLDSEQLGEPVVIFGQPFTLVGITESTAGFGGGSSAYISIENARSLFAQLPYVSTIEVQAASSEAVDRVEASVSSYLLDRYQVDDQSAQFSIMNQASIQDAVGSITGTLSLLLGGIATISLVVGGIGIMNIMLVSVRERTKEIGIRRAIGATRGQILSQFLIEATVLSIIGGLVGLLVGEGVAWLISVIADWAFTIDVNTVGLALIFSLLVGVIFGAWPARSASRLQPVEALRFE